MMYGSYHRIVNASKMDAPKESVAVAGNICESGDVFTGKGPDAIRKIGDPKIGDCIAILIPEPMDCQWLLNIILRVPAEILVKNKNVEMIRRRQDFGDLVVNFNWFDG